MEAINLYEQLLAKPPKNELFYSVAVDGRGGSGKSSLIEYLCQLLPSFDLMNGDDYFEPVESDIVWGAFNDARFVDEVIKPLQTGRTFSYMPYIWDAGGLQSPVEVAVKSGIVIERCFSFGMPIDWDLKIWVETPADVCLTRGIDRELLPTDQVLRAWQGEWQPREDEYIARLDPVRMADIVLNGELDFAQQLVSSEHPR
jgi:uridine kinase